MKASVSRLGTAVHNFGLRALHKRGREAGAGKDSNLGVGVGVTWLSQLMGWTDNSSGYESLCTANCSGHGECMNGTCFCEVSHPLLLFTATAPPLLSLSLSPLVLFLKNSKKKTYLKCPLKEKKKITKSDNNPRDEIDKKKMRSIISDLKCDLGPVRRCSMFGTQRGLPRRFRQCFPSGSSDVADSAVYLHSR